MERESRAGHILTYLSKVLREKSDGSPRAAEDGATEFDTGDERLFARELPREWEKETGDCREEERSGGGSACERERLE